MVRRLRAIASLRTAIGFLTRVPVGHVANRPGLLKGAVPWFPVVGAAIGALQGLVFVGLISAVPPLVASSVAVATALLITGAFHHDGLADMADAFGGGWDLEQRLSILKDSRLGTYGTAALTMALIIEVATLSSFDRWRALTVLVVAHAVSRAAAVIVMTIAPVVGDGMGASYMSEIGWPQAAAAVGAAAAATGLAATTSPQWWLAVVMVGAVAVATVAVIGLSNRKIGGVTGDVLGATQVITFLVCLVVLSAS